MVLGALGRAVAARGRATALLFIIGAPPLPRVEGRAYRAARREATPVYFVGPLAEARGEVAPHLYPFGQSTKCFAQWLLWEEQSNFSGFRTTTRPIELEVARIERSRVEVRTAGPIARELAERMFSGDFVHFPKHPLNRDAGVAFRDVTPSEHWRARFTSSRTLVVWDGFETRPFAVKLATDHPHTGVCQPEKTELREEVREALLFAEHVLAVDARLGRDPELLLLLESIGVSVPGSQTGMLVRDLAPLRDGHFYLPAFSIPFVGRTLAAAAGESFSAFWGAGYAEPVGRAKAKLLARYGLQYQTPNPQNILVQLDARFRPTGAIVLRDLADTDFVTDAGRECGAPWTRLTASLAPETANSFWAFEQAPASPADAATLAAWHKRHDRAYVDELRRQRDLPSCDSLDALAKLLARV